MPRLREDRIMQHEADDRALERYPHIFHRIPAEPLPLPEPQGYPAEPPALPELESYPAMPERFPEQESYPAMPERLPEQESYPAEPPAFPQLEGYPAMPPALPDPAYEGPVYIFPIIGAPLQLLLEFLGFGSAAAAVAAPLTA